MFTVYRTDEFSRWLDGLKDASTRARLIRRLQKVERDLLGDVVPVGDGVSEMREHFGPGWRMYYLQRGSVLLLMAVCCPANNLHMKSRLRPHGCVANPRDTTGYRCGLRLALRANASISFHANICGTAH